jgi:lysozyme
MDLSPKGAAFIRTHEGFVDHAYEDAIGVLTLGIGFTWGSDGFREWWDRNRPGQAFGPGATMTREEADKALIFVCAMEYGAAVNRFLGREVRQHIFDGMVSPVFNLGPGALEWRWAKAVKEGELEEAAQRLRQTGTTAKGKLLTGLVRRRREEAELLLNGDYSIGDATQETDPMSDGILRRGERGNAVAELQRKLVERKHYTGRIDGIFGYGTEAAVTEFQRANRLTVDGVAGPETLKALGYKPASSPARPEKPPASVPTPGNTLPPRVDEPAGQPARVGIVGLIVLGLIIVAAVAAYLYLGG